MKTTQSIIDLIDAYKKYVNNMDRFKWDRIAKEYYLPLLVDDLTNIYNGEDSDFSHMAALALNIISQGNHGTLAAFVNVLEYYEQG